MQRGVMMLRSAQCRASAGGMRIWRRMMSQTKAKEKVDPDYELVQPPPEEELWRNHPYAMLQEELKQEKEKRRKREKRTMIGLRVLDEEGWCWSLAQRKTAKAIVKVRYGTGRYMVNGKPMQSYFSAVGEREECLKPLEVLRILKKVDVVVKARGGGTVGKCQAIGVAVSRALSVYNEEYKEFLNSTRPSPMVRRPRTFVKEDKRKRESKTPGFMKARKQRQWRKR